MSQNKATLTAPLDKPSSSGLIIKSECPGAAGAGQCGHQAAEVRPQQDPHAGGIKGTPFF